MSNILSNNNVNFYANRCKDRRFKLFSRNPLDPDQVKEVRKQYLSIIRQWIADANQSNTSDRQL